MQQPIPQPARWLIVCLLLAGCGFRDGSRDPVTTRDSAGVRIVESVRPSLPPGSWSVSAEPVLSIGAVEGDPNQELTEVSAAIGLPGGGIVLSDRNEPFVRWYDARGAFVRGAGRRGGGPAEFSYGSPRALWTMPGDSLVAWDVAMPPRIKIYAPGGEYIRSFPVQLPHEIGGTDAPEVVGGTSAGFVIRWSRVSTSREQGALGSVAQDTIPFFAFGADGSFAGTVARRPAIETYLEEIPLRAAPPLRVRSPFPYGLQPAAQASGGYLYYGSGARYEIEVYALNGALVRLLRKRVPRRPVTGAVRNAWVEEFLKSSADPLVVRGRQRTLRTLPFADSVPAYRRMRVDTEGALWVSDYALPGQTTVSWSVFDADGRWLTDLSLPTSWRIFEIGGDYILVLITDDMDVQYVQKYRLTRARQ